MNFYFFVLGPGFFLGVPSFFRRFPSLSRGALEPGFGPRFLGAVDFEGLAFFEAGFEPDILAFSVFLAEGEVFRDFG